MKTMQREDIETRLVRERKRILASLRVLRAQAEQAGGMAAGDLSSYPLHLAEQASGALEREQAMAEAAQQGRYLSALDAALQRLCRDPDRFGICEACGEQIPAARLEVVPHTRYCLACKQGAQRSPVSPGAGRPRRAGP